MLIFLPRRRSCSCAGTFVQNNYVVYCCTSCGDKLYECFDVYSNKNAIDRLIKCVPKVGVKCCTAGMQLTATELTLIRYTRYSVGSRGLYTAPTVLMSADHDSLSWVQLIPPKRFDIFSLITGGCSEGLDVL